MPNDKSSKKTLKMFKMLEALELDDAKHRNYLEEECDQLDLMGAWSNIMEAAGAERPSVNPDDLMVSYLLGISRIDPLKKRAIVASKDGIADKAYQAFAIVLENGERLSVHQRTLIRTWSKTPFSWRDQDGELQEYEAGQNDVQVKSLRPGMEVQRRGGRDRVRLVVPADKVLFDEVLAEEPFEDEQGLLVTPRTGKHHWVETNEYPDIDIDYPPHILDKIIPWAEERYGADRVVGVATYQKFGMKSSLKDVCRVHDVHLADVLRIAEAMPDEVQKMNRADKDFDRQWQAVVEETPEIQEFLNVPGDEGETHRKIFEVMKGLQGKRRTISQHASAMIISRVSLDGAIPMVARKGVKLSSWAEGLDRSDLSKYGFVKLDRLGLQTLSDLMKCVELLYARGKLDRKEGLFRRPRPSWANDPNDDWMFADWSSEEYLEDQKVLQAAAEGRTIGCFQFESPGIREMLRQIKPERFEELVAANAMYRPGVLRAKIDGVDGGDKAFIARKRGEIQYDIPEALKPYLASTYGLLVYQEQVMKVLEIAGGVPATECEVARKAISKKRVEVLVKYRSMLERVAPRTVGWSKEEASAYFDDNIVPWSGYGFNRSHSFGYALIAVQTLWLKTHFPYEFYATFMSSVGKSKNEHDRLRVFIGDAARHGVRVIGVDINHSRSEFSISPDPSDSSKEVIRYGLAAIKKVGKSAPDIVANQPYRSLGDYLRRGVRRKDVVMNLICAGAFDRFSTNHRALVNYYEGWIESSRRGVGPKRYETFLVSLGIARKDAKPEVEEFKNYCLGLVEEEVVEDEPLPLPSRDEEVEAELLDSVSEEVAAARVEEKARPKPKAKPMDVIDFKMWAVSRWGDRFDSETISLALEEAIGDIVPPDLDETVPDVTPSVRLAQAVEAYGSMSSFLNPINHVAVPVKWIANHGKPEADGSVQFHVDGYVTKVDKRYPKSGSGKPYWNVQIDDGFDRASITIWGNVWSGGGCSKNAFAMDDNGCRIVEGTDENGKPRYKTCRVDPPSKVVREGKLVRFSVSARNKYGHTIDDSHGACASLLPTSRGWSNEMS